MNILRSHPLGLAMCALLTVSPGKVGAEVPVPPDLKPGDKYHLAFTTNSLFGLPFETLYAWHYVFNRWQSAANRAGNVVGEGTSWKALISTQTTDARDWARVGANTPVYNMHMELVASGFNDFWDGSHRVDLGWDELGLRFDESRDVSVWTGSNSDGTRAIGKTLGSNFSMVFGSSILKDQRWIRNGVNTGGLQVQRRLYVLSEELTVGSDVGEPDVAINAGLSDAWHDPQTPGQGIFITVLPEIEKIFLAWFTFDTERPPEVITAELGDPGHRWLTAFGDYSGDSAVLEVELTSGGVFGAAQPAPLQTASYGTITLEFTGCNELDLRFSLPSLGTDRIELQRISDDKVALCEELSSSTTAANIDSPAVEALPDLAAINAGLSDAWFDPQTPGQGFFMTVLPEIEQIFLAWFTFDTERPPEGVSAVLGDPGHRWLTALGDYSGTSAALEVELTSGGVFDPEYADPVVMQTVSYGNITLEFTSCNELELEYELPSVARTGVIGLQRISDGNVRLCEALSRP